MEQTLDQRIEKVGGECIGVFNALVASRNTLGDDIVAQFLGKVQEENSAAFLIPSLYVADKTCW